MCCTGFYHITLSFNTRTTPPPRTRRKKCPIQTENLKKNELHLIQERDRGGYYIYKSVCYMGILCTGVCLTACGFSTGCVTSTFIFLVEKSETYWRSSSSSLYLLVRYMQAILPVCVCVLGLTSHVCTDTRKKRCKHTHTGNVC